MYLLGYDIGSSSIKASLLDAETGRLIAGATSPETELGMITLAPGWAEQEPETWWEHVINATRMLKSQGGADLSKVKAIGIAYQMHGLVVVDKDKKPLRPSIIWCDSRAVQTGEDAGRKIGDEACLESLLNFPGNFTASRLAWVKNNEPRIYSKIHKAMLPGDYIAMRMTGEIVTTQSGLSEMILWDYTKDGIAQSVIDAFGLDDRMLPKIVPTFGVQGEISASASAELGVPRGTVVSYRAGDQPNNALSLNVLEPGEAATTAGTSGVVYAVGDRAAHDPASRVNTFIHVNDSKEKHRYGTLMCINGCGISFSWLRHKVFGGSPYREIDAMAERIAPGSEGLMVLPYGNGAERTLGNKDICFTLKGLRLNTHGKEHLARACQEGIVYALAFGFEIMKEMGLRALKVRAGNANLFLSPVFRDVFVNTLGTLLETYETDGSQGAARGAGIGSGIFKTAKDAFEGLAKTGFLEPEKNKTAIYGELYSRWKTELEAQLALYQA